MLAMYLSVEYLYVGTTDQKNRQVVVSEATNTAWTTFAFPPVRKNTYSYRISRVVNLRQNYAVALYTSPLNGSLNQ